MGFKSISKLCKADHAPPKAPIQPDIDSFAGRMRDDTLTDFQSHTLHIEP